MTDISRRNFVLGVACSAAAHPLMSRASFASVPSENRLVVIILRGAMDGLDVVRPVGAPEFSKYHHGLLHGTLQTGGFFGLHPKLAPLMPMWNDGELAFIHATSTPYRDIRSHFDGQDLLETGGADGVKGDGWLNRALAQIPGASQASAISVGRDPSLILHGDAPALSWAPEADLALTGQAQRLLQAIYHDDPLFREGLELAEILSQEQGGDVAQDQGVDGGVLAENGMGNVTQNIRGTRALARYTATRLLDETRIASFSIAGWDTHSSQHSSISRPLDQLADVLLTLKFDLGSVWDKTTVLAMTEFGRTVRINGVGGTDHGTGGAAVLAGGAVRGGRVFGAWPGLAYGDLYKGRDLRPTSDVRAHAGWLLHSLFGLEKSVIETTVFPRLDMGGGPSLLL